MTNLKDMKKSPLIWTFIAFLSACVIEASSEWLDSITPLNEPALTWDIILYNTFAIMFVYILIYVPVLWILWNKILTPIIGVNPLSYWRALAVASVLLWMSPN